MCTRARSRCGMQVITGTSEGTRTISPFRQCHFLPPSCIDRLHICRRDEEWMKEVGKRVVVAGRMLFATPPITIYSNNNVEGRVESHRRQRTNRQAKLECVKINRISSI